MPGVEFLEKKAAATRLTRKEGEVVEYILNNSSQVCFMPATNLAKELGTSDTTVNRAARALGYSSYSLLQQELQQTLSERADYSESILISPLERMTLKEQITEDSGVDARFSDLMAENLKSVFSKNSVEKLDRVVELLATSKVKYICGRRPTADIADKFGFLMRMIVDGVAVATDNCAFERIMDIGPADCLFLIDFNQYSKAAYSQLEYAHGRGAKIILLTDRPTAPIACFADELLLVDVYSLSFFNSNVAPLFLLELLCTRLSIRMKDAVKDRLNTLNPYFDSHKLKNGGMNMEFMDYGL